MKYEIKFLCIVIWHRNSRKQLAIDNCQKCLYIKKTNIDINIKYKCYYIKTLAMY